MHHVYCKARTVSRRSGPSERGTPSRVWWQDEILCGAHACDAVCAPFVFESHEHISLKQFGSTSVVPVTNCLTGSLPLLLLPFNSAQLGVKSLLLARLQIGLQTQH